MQALQREIDRIERRLRMPLAKAALCLLLAALLVFALSFHQHPFGGDADHCQICGVLHSILAPEAALAEIALVALGLCIALLRRTPPPRPSLTRICIRPPPPNC